MDDSREDQKFNWFGQFQAILWAAGLAATSLIFVYQSFATKEDVKSYVDVKHEGVMEILQDIREDVREIRNSQGRR